MSKYKFNREQLEFEEERRGLFGHLKRIFSFLLVTLLLAILYYLIFALLINTREEERIIRENEILNAEYQRSLERMELLDEVISTLQEKDREIYMNIFKSPPPNLLTQYNPSLYLQLDSSSNAALAHHTTKMLERAQKMVTLQQERFEEIFRLLEEREGGVKIPSIFPIKGFSISQTGAGVGEKIHPFYKTKYNHTGIDLLASLGSEVVATAPGVVTSVVRSDRARGNQIRVDHGEGYESYYAHLGDLLVRKGAIVAQGEVIARVGNSGLSFAPHLHYEVIYNGNEMDPINYLFGSLTPLEYREILVTSLNSGQSLD